MKIPIEIADKMISKSEFEELKAVVKKRELAIRCNKGEKYTDGDGFNVRPLPEDDRRAYATQLYASIGFAKAVIHNEPGHRLLLLDDCALASGDRYRFYDGTRVYLTFPKCHGLGPHAHVVDDWSMDEGTVKLARSVVKSVLALAPVMLSA